MECILGDKNLEISKFLQRLETLNNLITDCEPIVL